MDKIVVCPECGAQMTLQDGQVVFSCVDCGTRLYCIKGVVITKSQAKILLKKLVEKKQAEKARQLEIERISAKNVNETVRPEPPMPMQPVAPVQVKMPEPEHKINIAPPIAPAPKPVEKPAPKPEEKAEAAQIGKVNHTVKSGMAFAIFTYVFFTAFMFAWFYPLHKMSLSFVNALPSVANDELLKTIVGYVWIYFDLLVFLAWVCASSSFMSLGCVRRRKIDTGAELIASACTILNLPNVFLMLILSANRKKITKYKRSEYGVKYNIRKDYVPTIAVLETLTLAAVTYFLYTLVNPYFFVNTPDFSNYVKIIIDVASTMLIPFMAGVISLSRLIKIMARRR